MPSTFRFVQALATVAVSVAAFSLQPHAQPLTSAQPHETVTFSNEANGGSAANGLLLKPAGSAGPWPTVVMLHGCAGLYAPNGQLFRREIDWSQRFQNAGYAVLLVDSFKPRGLGSQCAAANRSKTPIPRARDAQQAVEWLGTQSWADPARIAVIGWSQGGSTVLTYVRQNFAPRDPRLNVRIAIAFYPGCRVSLERDGPRPGLNLEIHMGEADDWTPPEPCIALSKQWAVPITLYPNAYHGFDAPDVTVRILTGLAFSKAGDGRAHVGTNPEARAKAIEAVMKRLSETFSKR